MRDVFIGNIGAAAMEAADILAELPDHEQRDAVGRMIDEIGAGLYRDLVTFLPAEVARDAVLGAIDLWSDRLAQLLSARRRGRLQ